MVEDRSLGVLINTNCLPQPHPHPTGGRAKEGLDRYMRHRNMSTEELSGSAMCGTQEGEEWRRENIGPRRAGKLEAEQNPIRSVSWVHRSNSDSRFLQPMDSSDQTSAFPECGDAGEFIEEKSKGMEGEVVNKRGEREERREWSGEARRGACGVG